MSYIDYLIIGGLSLLVLFGLAAMITGFANAMTNNEFGGRVWSWWAVCSLGALSVAFAVVTIAYRAQS